MNDEPFLERLPQKFVELHCTQLAAWWGGSRKPLKVRLIWPSGHNIQAEVEAATVELVVDTVNGEPRYCVRPASPGDEAIIGHNALTWLARDPEFVMRSTPSEAWLRENMPGTLEFIQGAKIEPLPIGAEQLDVCRELADVKQKIADAFGLPGPYLKGASE